MRRIIRRSSILLAAAGLLAVAAVPLAHAKGGVAPPRVTIGLASCDSAFPAASGKWAAKNVNGAITGTLELANSPLNTTVYVFVDDKNVGTATTDGLGNASPTFTGLSSMGSKIRVKYAPDLFAKVLVGNGCGIF